MKYAAGLIVLLLGVATPAFGTQLNLTWDPAPTATQYILQVSSDAGVTWSELAIGSSPSFSINAPDDGFLYLYRAVNRNSAGDTPRHTPVFAHDSDWSPPSTPTNVAVQ